jgi:hypothetical protein
MKAANYVCSTVLFLTAYLPTAEASNTNRGRNSQIVGGTNNAINARVTNAVIVGGQNNRIATGANNAVIAGGNRNTINGAGRQAFIAGGQNNLANGAGAYAAGNRAQARSSPITSPRAMIRGPTERPVCRPA